jgi:hypothetical protein
MVVLTAQFGRKVGWLKISGLCEIALISGKLSEFFLSIIAGRRRSSAICLNSVATVEVGQYNS